MKYPSIHPSAHARSSGSQQLQIQESYDSQSQHYLRNAFETYYGHTWAYNYKVYHIMISFEDGFDIEKIAAL